MLYILKQTRSKYINVHVYIHAHTHKLLNNSYYLIIPQFFESNGYRDFLVHGSAPTVSINHHDLARSASVSNDTGLA